MAALRTPAEKLRLCVLIVCVSTFAQRVGALSEILAVNGVPQVPAHHGSPPVSILRAEEAQECGIHCIADVQDDDIDDDDARYQDGEDVGYLDDEQDDNGVTLVDQRQNGTENYRIRVNGLLLIITPPELPVPPPSSTVAPPLVPPTVLSNGTDPTLSSWSGTKMRFNVRRHGQNTIEQQKHKFSKYQARIPQFIKALLRNRFAQLYNP